MAAPSKPSAALDRAQFLPYGLAILFLCAGCRRTFQFSIDKELPASATATNSAAIPANITAIEVENYDGQIKVAGATGGPYHWTQELAVQAGKDAIAQTTLRTMACQAVSDGSKLKLIVAAPSAHEHIVVESDLEIEAPTSVSVTTRNHYGSTFIARVDGPVDVSDDSGRVRIQEIAREVHAQTTYAALGVSHTGAATLSDQSGKVEAIDIRGPLTGETSYASFSASDVSGPVKLRDQSGSVSVERAASADVQTSYATLRVNGVAGDATLKNQSGSVDATSVAGTVRASTSYGAMRINSGGTNIVCQNQSGAIEIHAESPKLANLEATTSYGSLAVWIPGNLTVPFIRATTTYASVESDFPTAPTALGNDPFANLPPGSPRIVLVNQSGKISARRGANAP